MKIGHFTTDARLEQDGVWVDVAQGLRLKVARLSNPRFLAFSRKISKPHQRQLRLGILDDATIRNLAALAMSRHILLDWEGLEDDRGQPIPYSADKAHELLKTVPDFYRLIEELAADADLFKQQETEELKGNLPAVSSGSSPGDSTKSS
jgi:hypothetical protein